MLIFERSRVLEIEYHVNSDYLKQLSHIPEITTSVRSSLVQWMISIHIKENIPMTCLSHAVSLVDRFLSVRTISRKKIQLLASCCIIIACKLYEVIYPPTIQEVVRGWTKKLYSRENCRDMEFLILKTFGCHVHNPSIMTFALLILDHPLLMSHINDQEKERILERVDYLHYNCLLHYHMLQFLPSTMATAIIILSFRTHATNPITCETMLQELLSSLPIVWKELNQCLASIAKVIELFNMDLLSQRTWKYPLSIVPCTFDLFFHNRDTNTLTITKDDNILCQSHSPIFERSRSINDLYKVVKQIANGSFGKVYKAKILNTTNQFVAIKILIEDNEEDEEEEGMPSNCLRELVNLISIPPHPNLVKLQHIFLGLAHRFDPQQIALVFEYMPFTLQQFIEQTTVICSGHYHSYLDVPANLDRIRSVFRQIVLGIVHIHSLGFIHRDLKGSNILCSAVEEQVTVKICDWGSSRFFGRQRRHMYRLTSPICTLWYRSPEDLLNQNYNESIDVWSLGCLLYELLTGAVLFLEESEVAMLNLIHRTLMTKDPDSVIVLLPHQPLANDLLLKMLNMDGMERMSAADVLKHPFFY